MIIRNINHDYGYHTQKIATMFFPLEKIRSDGEDSVVIETKKEGLRLTVSVKAFSKIKAAEYEACQNEDMAHAMSVLLFKTLVELTGFRPSWGILYGVRPARLMHATAEEIGEEAAREKFVSYHLASPQKAELAIEVMKCENKIIALSKENSFSLYVSIPFCPTRCSYCSFVSHSIQNAADLISPYVDLLCREIEENGKIARELNLRLETIYFGGGTPTTLSAAQLDKICKAIAENFDLSTLREYTVEAGRPDTITERKLNTLLENNVQRISINPQTFNDDVLEAIGRH